MSWRDYAQNKRFWLIQHIRWTVLAQCIESCRIKMLVQLSQWVSLCKYNLHNSLWFKIRWSYCIFTSTYSIFLNCLSIRQFSSFVPLLFFFFFLLPSPIKPVSFTDAFYKGVKITKISWLKFIYIVCEVKINLRESHLLS